MHRIDTKTAQKDKFGAGKNGFTRGNPQTGTPATDLDDDYFSRSLLAVNEVTPAEIQDLAQRYLCKETLKEIVSGKKMS